MSSPFERVAAVRAELREGVTGTSTDGSMAEDLIEAVSLLERVHAIAVQMQEGYEGFDNAPAARFYADVQTRLLAAAGEAAQACEHLAREHRRSLLRTHVPKHDVLGRLHGCHADLEAALGELTDEEMVEEGALGDSSVKEKLAQLIAREQLVLDRLRHALLGERLEDAPDCAGGFDARLVETLCSKSLAEVSDTWRASFDELVATVEGMTDDDFSPTGPTARALGESIHMALAYSTYGRYAEVEAAVRRLAERPDRQPRQ